MGRGEPAPASGPAGEWDAILDRLELEISLAFAGESSGWEPPANPGPIPPELVGRALQLLDAQRETAQFLTLQQLTTARHLDALDAIPDSRGTGRSRLLDVQG